MATSRKVVRKPGPRKTITEETSPGDMIELSITEEVKTRNASRWVKIGLVSQHREGETTAEAIERIESFVVDGLTDFIAAATR